MLPDRWAELEWSIHLGYMYGANKNEIIFFTATIIAFFLYISSWLAIIRVHSQVNKSIINFLTSLD